MKFQKFKKIITKIKELVAAYYIFYKKVPSKVPSPGSVLGSLLFLLYINNLNQE